MTEAEWLFSLDPLVVFPNLKGKPSGRKMRLAAIACCRDVWHLLTDERSKAAVDAAELFADKLVSSAVVLESEATAIEVVDIFREYGVAASDSIADAAAAAAFCATLWASADWGTFQVLRCTTHSVGRSKQMQILACVFRIPYRKLFLDPTWLTPTVTALASGIYTNRAFDRMPILADALEEAGCDNADVLLHCRGDGPHVKGCWVVDAVLGKE